VRALRRATGLSVADMAVNTGISKSMVSKIENAQRSCSPSTLAKLAAMLEGVMIYRHSESEYTMRPGDTLLIDGEGLHGPHDLVRMPIRFLAVTAYPDSRE
jgi:transcriptional regulator with XRE-family HTH domain